MTISMPSNAFRASRFGLETNTATFESPSSKATQRLLFAGSRWVAAYTLPRMTRATAADWQAFLLKLEGRANTFYGYDPDARTGRGVLTGTPLVKGAGQTGSAITIDGCTPNVTNWIRAGDYISFGGELKMATADGNTNGSGEITIPFKPAIRASPADNAPVTVANAACEMILTDDAQAMWEADMNGVCNEMTFTATEVFQ